MGAEERIMCMSITAIEVRHLVGQRHDLQKGVHVEPVQHLNGVVVERDLVERGEVPGVLVGVPRRNQRGEPGLVMAGFEPVPEEARADGADERAAERGEEVGEGLNERVHGKPARGST
jgi:hypothetical protein